MTRCYPCPSCEGTGRVHGHLCDGSDEYLACHGSGEVELDTESAMAFGLLTPEQAAELLLDGNGGDWAGAKRVMRCYGLELIPELEGAEDAF